MTGGIDFAQIAPRCGGQREAFEEFCCQLARNSSPDGSSFVRLHGAGGDGGVECYAELHDGTRVGWQAKYVFDIEDLLTQLTISLRTALAVHHSLRRYIVCFPFNLTGITRRKGRSGVEKFNAWRKREEGFARKTGRRLTIEHWAASKLIEGLLKIDPQGGIREFFFDSTVLSQGWFKEHLALAFKEAGPRYTAELTVDTDLWKWLSAFGRTEEWSNTFTTLLGPCRKELKSLRAAIMRGRVSVIDLTWPESLKAQADECTANLDAILSQCEGLIIKPRHQEASRCLANLLQSLATLYELESKLKDDLEIAHGKGADSAGFRQFMSEYQVSFPAGNLDSVRDLIKTVDSLSKWLNSPAAWLAFESKFLLLGIAGSGKTHGVCDAASRQLLNGQLSIVTFGHIFGGEPDPWSRLREYLGLPGTLGRDGLLDALNAAGEASGHVLIIYLDAINETKPLRYWRERLLSFAEAIIRRPFLRLCVTCRTSFVPNCVPTDENLYRAEHQGFSGIEREACRAFFTHYELDPPVIPILQPELANPLYLKLVCQTLKAKGLKALPSGWIGLSTAIQAFLSEKNRAFALEHDMSEGNAIVSRSMSAIASEIARLSVTTLSWSAADRVIRSKVSISPALQPVSWLLRENLLIEDASREADPINEESAVRPAFERLGEFLVAQELLAGMTPGDFRKACETNGRLAPYFGSLEGVSTNEGVVSALSVLIPEQFAQGTELPDLFEEGPIHSAVSKITVSSYLWRDPSSFTNVSQATLRKTLGMPGYATAAMDAALLISCQPSVIDANWLHSTLVRRSMAIRDAFWCAYLHKSYEESGPVFRLIKAVAELPVNQTPRSAADRWTTILLWFTAAADRRVKDYAFRAAVALLRIHKQLVPNVVRRMMTIDDDAVRERTLLAAYAVCLFTKDASVLGAICDVLAGYVANSPINFHNALLRDHARSIGELAQMLGVGEKAHGLLSLLDGLSSPWPLDIPSDAQIEHWNNLPRLVQSCLDDDFFTYSMGCLDEWGGEVTKPDMGKWILQRVAENFGYTNAGCERYDRTMLSVYGGGRAKPTWAERIGKKYQWIAMYQLAARLFDHVPRNRNNWEPGLLRKPLILIEERQLDPTLPKIIADREWASMPWWIPASVDFSGSEHLGDEAWVQKREDVPNLRQFLKFTESGGKKWLLLEGYPSWKSRLSNTSSDAPYRNLWIHIRGYLVDAKHSANAFASLVGRNFFGRWMPEGASWSYGFAGEYPWGAAFTTEPEWYHGRGGNSSESSYDFIPACSEIAAEWQYDASLPRNIHIPVPARVFFDPGDLWWNGQDGFIQEQRGTVFCAPEVVEPGPPALIADRADLLERLNRINKRVIWTLLGEKLVIGGPHDKRSPRCTFSQAAILNGRGSIRFSKLKFFNDYQESTGPLGKQGRVRTKSPILPQKKEAEPSGRSSPLKGRTKGQKAFPSQNFRNPRANKRVKSNKRKNKQNRSS